MHQAQYKKWMLEKEVSHMKRWGIALIIIGAMFMIVSCIKTKRNIICISKEVVVIKGSCITINWDASETDVEVALKYWMTNK